MPSRTLSPRISTTVTVMSLLMTMLSFFFLDSTNLAAYPSPKDKMPFLLYWFPTRGERLGGQERAGEDPLPQLEPGVSHGDARFNRPPPRRNEGLPLSAGGVGPMHCGWEWHGLLTPPGPHH